MKIKRFTALLLTAAIVITLLAGCSRDAGTDGNTPGTQNGQQSGQSNQPGQPGVMVYQAEFQQLDMPYQPEWISSYCASGNVIYFAGNCITGTEILTNEVTGEPYIDELTGEPMKGNIYETKLFALDTVTRQVTVLEGFQLTEIPEGMLGDSYMVQMTIGADGSLWLLEEMYTYYYDLPEDYDPEVDGDEIYMYYMPGETRYIITQFSTDGQILRSFDLETGANEAEGEYFYPSGMHVDSHGNIFVGSYDKTVVMDQDGKALFTVDEEGSGQLVSFGNDKIGVLAYDYENNTQIFKPIDLTLKGYGVSMQMPANASRIYPGIEGYTFLFDNYSDDVFAYSAETGETKKLFSWMDCDISRDYIQSFLVQTDGTVYALSNDYTQTERSLELVEMKLVDSSTVPQKQQLTLACMWLDSMIRAEIIEFNKKSTDVRINVVDYSQYNTADDPSGGITRLNTEIMSGKMPDLLITGDLPVRQYAAKGLLLDLWTMIDSDPELSREDLMTHFFEAISVDGKLYEIYDSFSIQTAVANGDYVGSRTSWTLEEMLQVLQTLEDGAYIFSEGNTKETVLSTCLNRSLSAYINWETYQCSFDSQAFIDVLNFANSFPLEYDWNDYEWDPNDSEFIRMTTGRQLMAEYYLSCFDDIQYAVATAGKNPVFVGYPSSNGTGSVFSVYSGMAISASCSNPDAAWSFVRQFLTEEHQKQEYYWEFPTNRHCFEEYAQQKMTQEYEKDPKTGEYLLDENGEKIPIYQGGWQLEDGTEFQIGAMTQAQFDQFMALYESCSATSSYNEQINQLVLTEVQAFFNGEKTAEQTAKTIQQIITVYVMEQS